MKLLNLGSAYSLFDVATATISNSDPVALPGLASQVTWQSFFGTNPASITLQILTSNDNISYSVVDSSTVVTGSIQTFQTSALFVKARINAISGGVGVSISIVPKQVTIGATTLESLTDVNISGPTDSQVLTYDGGSSKWINADSSGGGGGVAGISNFTPAVDGESINLLPPGILGTVLIGDPTSAIAANGGVQGSALMISGDDNPVYPYLVLSGINDNGAIFLNGAAGTLQIPTALQSGSGLGAIDFAGFGATEYQNGAQISVVSTQNFSDTASGTRINISTVANNSIDLTLALMIDQDGTVHVGSGSSTDTTLILGPRASSFATICGMSNGSYLGINGLVAGGTLDSSHSVALINDSGLVVKSGAGIGFSSSATDPFGSGADTLLVRGAAAQVNVTAGDGSTAGVMNAASYKAGGTAGVTAGPFTVITAITVKGGIITAITGS